MNAYTVDTRQYRFSVDDGEVIWHIGNVDNMADVIGVSFRPFLFNEDTMIHTDVKASMPDVRLRRASRNPDVFMFTHRGCTNTINLRDYDQDVRLVYPAPLSASDIDDEIGHAWAKYMEFPWSSPQIAWENAFKSAMQTVADFWEE